MDKKIKPLGTILFLFTSALILFLPAFFRWKGIFHNDQAMSEWLRHYFLAWNLQRGIFPLWDPHVWCGAMPHYAFIFSAENYYFLIWPFLYLADLINLDNAYQMICLLPLFMHYFIAISGMFLLLKRVIKCNWLASFAGAFAYMYSPVFAYAYVSQDNLIMQAWLPWLIYVYYKTLGEFAYWKLFLGGLIFSFIWFGGKLQYMPFIMFIWIGFILLLAVQSHSERNKFSLIKPVGIAALMFILGTALSAVYLLPLVEGLKFTGLHLDLNLSSAINHKPANMPLAYLVTLFLPGFYGSITGQHFIFDRLMFWDANMSAGMMTTFVIFLAALIPAAFFSRALQDKIQHKFIILGISLYIFSILCVLGGNAPFYRVLIGWIPVVNLLPYPIRYRMIQCFAASLLVGLGINFILSCGSTDIKRRLSKFTWVYLGISFVVIIAVLFWPQNKGSAASWITVQDIKVKGFLASHQAVGLYTPKTARVKKIRVIFDGPCAGEIRYADAGNVLPAGGRLVRHYSVAQGGWQEFDVDIPPDKFLWFLPVSGEGRLGYWESDDHCFILDNTWRINQRASAINIYAQRHAGKTALFFRLISGYVESKPVVFSLFYWAVLVIFIVIGIRLFSLKQFGHLTAILVIFEFFYFGTKAFYGCTFNEAQTGARSFLPHNVRAKVPSEHPMFKYMLKGVFPLIQPDMRIAAEYPFYDNLVYLNHGFALMGEPPFPLEKRFKKAIEAAYERPMDQSMFYEGGGKLPVSGEFLNNFSVKYFITDSAKKIFDEEQSNAVNIGLGNYLHINKEVLPRAYTVKNVFFVSQDRQLKELVSGELENAVYLSPEEGCLLTNFGAQNNVFDFQEMQNKNSVDGLDFSNPNEVSLIADIDIPAMLVLTEVWFPGWEAFDGSRRTEIYRVNYCQRGIWLEKGRHEIKFRFRPLAWRIGLGVSLCAALGMGIFLIIKGIKHDK